MATAKQNALEALTDLLAVPWGQGPGEVGPGGAINRTSSDEYIRCYVRNWSAQLERDYVFEAISQYQGGEKSKELAMKKGDDFDLVSLREKHRLGQNADIIHHGVKAIPKVEMKFDGKYFTIPASKDPKKDPEWIGIPQGVMDLYYGNYDRIHGLDKNEANKELELVRGRRRYDPCIRKNARGENTNKFGYLEFRREIIEPSAMAVDADHVFTEDFIEV